MKILFMCWITLFCAYSTVAAAQAVSPINPGNGKVMASTEQDTQCSSGKSFEEAMYEVKLAVTGLDGDKTFKPAVWVSETGEARIAYGHEDGSPNVRISVRVRPAGASLPVQMKEHILQPLLVEMQLLKYVNNTWTVIAAPSLVAGLNSSASMQMGTEGKDMVSVSSELRRVSSSELQQVCAEASRTQKAGRESLPHIHAL